MALLVHGLGGCHQSAYMQRIAARLTARGVRTFRLDLRGCGAGFSLARWPYHAGRSEDLAAAVRHIADLYPEAPLSVVGFSLGGGMVLKMAGEFGPRVPSNLASVMAVNPPVSLAASSEHIARPAARYYDRYFARLLWRQVQQRRHVVDRQDVALPQPPRTLREFDDLFTAPLGGFGSASEYYQAASADALLPEIRVPTCILSSRDDPLIPIEPLVSLPRNPHVNLMLTERGGHLGFIAGKTTDPDRCWMDWRVVDWIAQER